MNNFFKRVFKNGKYTKEEVLSFMLENYFLKGYRLEDFEDDLVFNYNRSERYARALKERFEDHLKEFLK